MSAASFRDKYFEALGLKQQGEGAKEKLAAALSRAHDIRKFEIELYWKRASYFWAFQLVAFTALGLLFKDGKLEHLGLLILPGVIGALTAFAGYLTARGSKFWQENWEAHVDLLEGELEGRLTQVVLYKENGSFSIWGPLEFSVSRVNQSLLAIFSLGWMSVLFAAGLLFAVPSMQLELQRLSRWYVAAPVFVAVIGCGLWMCFKMRSDLKGRRFVASKHEADAGWQEFPPKRQGLLAKLLELFHKRSDRRWATIWRDPPDGSLAG